MASRRTLERLLRLRELEEEQSRQLLEEASRRQARAQGTLTEAVVRERAGRGEVVRAVVAGQSLDRVGGLLELGQAVVWRERVAERAREAEAELARQRAEYRLRRTSRQQVETLGQEAAAERETADRRRAQQMLDDWFGQRQRQAAAPRRRAAADSVPEQRD